MCHMMGMAPVQALSHGIAVLDPYAELGLTRGKVSKEDVRKAFLRCAMQSHPDKNPNTPGAEDRFKRVQAAYDQLRALASDASPASDSPFSSFAAQPGVVPPASSFVRPETVRSAASASPCDFGVFKETISLEEMGWDEVEGAFTFDCHCSGRFTIPGERVGAVSELIDVNCETCSLWVQVRT